MSAFGGKADMTFCTKVDIALVLEVSRTPFTGARSVIFSYRYLAAHESAQITASVLPGLLWVLK